MLFLGFKCNTTNKTQKTTNDLLCVYFFIFYYRCRLEKHPIFAYSYCRKNCIITLNLNRQSKNIAFELGFKVCKFSTLSEFITALVFGSFYLCVIVIKF